MLESEALNIFYQGKRLADVLIESKGLYALSPEDVSTLNEVKRAWHFGHTENEILLRRAELTVYSLSLLIGTLALYERRFATLSNLNYSK